MKIISKFKDYYDFMQMYGQDPNITYVRMPDVIDVPSLDEAMEDAWFRSRFNYNVLRELNLYSAVIGVAGRFYPIVYSREVDYHKTDAESRTSFPVCLYSVEEVIEYVHNVRYLSKAYKQRILEELKQNLSSKRKRFDVPLTSFFEFFSKHENEEIFKHFSTPVLVITPTYNGWKISTNVNLSKYKFGRVMEGFEAYTAIEFFLFSILKIAEPEIVDIADRYKIEQHGFGKCSFRNKSPGKNRKKRKDKNSLKACG